MNAPSRINPDQAHVTVRRARPWLGTLVEIRAAARHADDAERAIAAGFAAVAQVQRLMNFHDEASELRRLMAAPLHRPWPVHPWTWQVLSAAHQIAEFSGGAFDFTLSSQWRHLEILPENQVLLRRHIPLDLSGIAKGFAVDMAVAALRSTGAHSGVVNAGGDLRVFGPDPEALHVRCPTEPGRLIAAGFLADEAAATSGNYFDAPGSARLRNPHHGRTALARGCVTVCAPTCLLADGLTKVVAVLGLKRAQPVLTQYAASAFVLRADGRTEILETSAHAA